MSFGKIFQDYGLVYIIVYKKMIDKIIVRCVTYKEAFTLRRALIELGINWNNCSNFIGISNFKKWKYYWDKYKSKTIYVFNKNYIKYGNSDTINRYVNLKEYDVMSLKTFIKKYIFKYSKNE